MTQRKGTTIKQGALADVMSRLSELPEREKDPGAAVSLAEVFRTKEYLAEIKAALKKGYTFENLARIFTEKCGVGISARQLKYHFTREKNKKMKNNVAVKANRPDTQNDDIPPENPTRTGPCDEAEADTVDAGAAPNVTAHAEIGSAETGAFFFERFPRSD